MMINPRIIDGIALVFALGGMVAAFAAWRRTRTKAMVEVARLVAGGLSNNEVAERLGVSYFTARNHVERVLAKLGVGNRSRVGAVLRNEAA